MKAILDALNKYSGIVSAFATVVLAILTYSYLGEVREQRLYNYKQLALENTPLLEILGPEPFGFGATLRTATHIINRGGPIENLRVATVIVCCEDFEKASTVTEQLETLLWGGYRHRFSRGQRRSFFMGFNDDKRAWLEPALKDESGRRVFAYIQAKYTRPSNPVESEAELQDSASFWWNPKFKRWMSLSPEGNEILEKTVTKREMFIEWEKESIK